MNYWLMKTEPSSFSIDDLERKGREHWDGVRNYQARNNLQAMKVGDLALIYHSGKTPAVVGLAKVVKAPYPDFTAFDPGNNHFDPKSSEDKPTWYMVDVEFVKKFPQPIALTEIKADSRFDDMPLVKSSRLSVQPVAKKHYNLISNLPKS